MDEAAQTHQERVTDGVKWLAMLWSQTGPDNVLRAAAERIVVLEDQVTWLNAVNAQQAERLALIEGLHANQVNNLITMRRQRDQRDAGVNTLLLHLEREAPLQELPTWWAELRTLVADLV